MNKVSPVGILVKTINFGDHQLNSVYSTGANHLCNLNSRTDFALHDNHFFGQTRQLVKQKRFTFTTLCSRSVHALDTTS